MAKIQELLDNLLHKKLGRDVRQSIHDSIEQCYKDATGHPDSVAAVIKENKEMQEHLDNTPYMFLEEGEEKDLPVHTINDDEVSTESAFSSKKTLESIDSIKKTLESIVSIKKNYNKYFDNDENVRHTAFDIGGKIGVELFYIDRKHYGDGVDANGLYGVPLETSYFYSHVPFLIAGLKGKSLKEDGAYGNITATAADAVVSLNKGDGAQYKFDAYINNANSTSRNPSVCILCIGKLA